MDDIEKPPATDADGHEGLRRAVAADAAVAGHAVDDAQVARIVHGLHTSESGTGAAFRRHGLAGLPGYIGTYYGIRGKLPDENILVAAAQVRGEDGLPFLSLKPEGSVHGLDDMAVTQLRHAASQGRLARVREIFSDFMSHETDPSVVMMVTAKIWEGAMGVNHLSNRQVAQFHIAEWLEEIAFDSLIHNGVSVSQFQVTGHINYQKRRSKLPWLAPEMLVGLDGTDHLPVRARAYRAIRHILSYEYQQDMSELNRKAYFCALIFGSADRLMTYFRRWGQDFPNPLTRILKDIDPPLFTHIDYSTWGDALIRHGPEMAFLMNYITRVPGPLPVRGEGGGISLRLTREKISNQSYLRREQDPALADVFFDVHADEKTFNRALTLVGTLQAENPPAPSPEDTIPDIRIPGIGFGFGADTVFRRLDWADRRMLMVGGYSGCCEKLGGAFEGTVMHALKTRRSGFYVVEKAGRIVAHTWAWRGQAGELIIDGFESANPDFRDANIGRLLDGMYRELCDPAYEPYGIRRVVLGLSTGHLQPHTKYPPVATPAEKICARDHFGDFEIINGMGHLGNADEQFLVGDIRYYPSWHYLDMRKPGL